MLRAPSPQVELQHRGETELLRLELQMVETERVRLSLLEEKLVDVLQLLQRLRDLVGPSPGACGEGKGAVHGAPFVQVASHFTDATVEPQRSPPSKGYKAPKSFHETDIATRRQARAVTSSAHMSAEYYVKSQPTKRG